MRRAVPLRGSGGALRSKTTGRTSADEGHPRLRSRLRRWRSLAHERARRSRKRARRRGQCGVGPEADHLGYLWARAPWASRPYYVEPSAARFYPGGAFAACPHATFVVMRSSLASARCGPTRFLLSVACAGAMGCGVSGPPLLTGDFIGGTDAGSSPGPANSGGSLLTEAGPPPSCEAGTSQGRCGAPRATLLSDAPNLYFMLDRSGSMTTDDKWLTIRTVIASVMQRIGPRAKFGAAVFPNPEVRTIDCSTGIQVMPMTPGDAPAGTYGPTSATFTFATNYPAGGGTSPRRRSALSCRRDGASGQDVRDPRPTGGRIATRPSPATRARASRTSSPIRAARQTVRTAARRSRSTASTSAAAVKPSALAAAGIPTYVIGVPGSGPYAAVLDQMALGGGTARPKAPYYYAVDTADQAAFTAAISEVAAKITANCVLTDQAPPDPRRK